LIQIERFDLPLLGTSLVLGASLTFDASLASTLYLLALGENRQLSSGSEEYFFKKQFS
jgi:hypothetical protein